MAPVITCQCCVYRSYNSFDSFFCFSVTAEMANQSVISRLIMFVIHILNTLFNR